MREWTQASRARAWVPFRKKGYGDVDTWKALRKVRSHRVPGGCGQRLSSTS
jgi:hypothetical protein